MTAREFDVVLFGATGFTGKPVAGYLGRAREPKLTFALAGRNRSKLEAVARELDLDVPLIIADTLDPAACDGIAARTRVVCTTVGPYAKYGSALVAACAGAGTHYCDITGEVPWMRAMIDAHHERAKQTGARIVHACGFDSIPSDLGTWATQRAFSAHFGHPAQRVTALFGAMSGGFSGGTAASAFQIARSADDRDVRRVLGNPYGLDPDPHAPRPPAPDDRAIGWDAHLKMFTIPFFMADTNSRVVRRSHALAGLPWGSDFVYREVMSMPGNARGLAMAVGATGALGVLSAAMRRPRLRELLEKRAPKSGEGPDERSRKRGHWTVRFIAQHGDELLDYIAEDRHGDPGVGSTMKMLGESALCLAFDLHSAPPSGGAARSGKAGPIDPLASAGGVLTPSVAMGNALLERLRAAGLAFHPMS